MLALCFMTPIWQFFWEQEALGPARQTSEDLSVDGDGEMDYFTSCSSGLSIPGKINRRFRWSYKKYIMWCNSLSVLKPQNTDIYNDSHVIIILQHYQAVII